MFFSKSFFCQKKKIFQIEISRISEIISHPDFWSNQTLSSPLRILRNLTWIFVFWSHFGMVVDNYQKHTCNFSKALEKNMTLPFNPFTGRLPHCINLFVWEEERTTIPLNRMCVQVCPGV